MVAILYYPLAMLGAVILWARWSKGKSGLWAFVLSLFAYAASVLTYENCVPLCLLFPLFSLLYTGRRRLGWSSLYGFLATLYATYRFSHGFGFGRAAIHGGSYFGEGERLGIACLLQNVRTLLSWWIGGLGAKSFLGGFNAFALLLPKWQFAFTVVSLLLLVAIVCFRKKMGETELSTTEIETHPVLLKGFVFGTAWVVLAYAPHLLFPAASRHHMIPIFGMGIVFAAALGLWKPKIPNWIWLGLAFLCLIANAGNGLAWKDTGIFCRRVYHHLKASQDQWKDRQLVLFDTVSLRERQTPGILLPRNDSAATWAEYQNAILLRGFVGGGMLKMCTSNPPQIIQDTEHGARIKNGILYWHDRYNPSVPHQTPMEDVYRVDCLTVAIQKKL